jgi:hypothetical protein
MVISNSSTNSLGATSYAQPSAAAQSIAASTSTTGTGDSVHLSATAQATGFHQQGLSISQIASLMGVTSKAVEGYLYITPTAAIGGGGGGGAEAASAPAKTAAPAASTTHAAATTKPAAVTTTVTATPKLKAA